MSAAPAAKVDRALDWLEKPRFNAYHVLGWFLGYALYRVVAWWLS